VSVPGGRLSFNSVVLRLRRWIADFDVATLNPPLVVENSVSELMAGYMDKRIFHLNLALAAFVAVVPLSTSGLLTAYQVRDSGATTYSLSGKVEDSKTRQGVSKAEVSLHSLDQKQELRVFTDISGSFVIQNVSPGRYEVAAHRTGYFDQAYGSAIPAIIEFPISGGRDVEGILIPMIPWSVISGRISDEDGEPIVGAEVSALERGIHWGRAMLFSRLTTQTNDLGDYRIYGLSSGRYYLRVQSRQSKSPGVPSYSPAYYPGVSEIANAEAVDVPSGEEVSAANIRLMPGTPVMISGSVSNGMTHKAVGGCCVFLEPRDEKLAPFALHGPGYLIDPTGSFEIRGVTPGAFTLIATTTVQGRVYYSKLPIEVRASGLKDVRMVIMPGGDIQGRIATETNTGFDFSRTKIQLEQFISDFGRTPQLTPKQDGSFSFADLPPGSYRIGVLGLSQDTYVKSVRVRGNDIPDAVLEVAAGNTVGPVEVAVSTGAGTISGSVADGAGAPLRDAFVGLVPAKRNLFQLYRHAVTDLNGHFVIGQIVPGDYEAFAWKKINAEEYEDEEFLRRFENEGVSLTIGPSANITVALKTNTTAER
jgi:Carboxypeptidase regulatory-like domain